MVLPFALTLTGSESNYKEDIEVMDNPIIDIIEPEINLINGKIDNREELIEAMAFVESGGNPATLEILIRNSFSRTFTNQTYYG